MLPRISIVTPSYNQGEFIEETIRSIVEQDYPNLEYVVIDGGSTDQTVEIIKKYASRIDYWVSEKDRGQSHAINKGIARCTGQIFNWINSDDQLVPGALAAVAKTWSQNPGAIIAGSMEHFNKAGTFMVTQGKGQTLRNFVRFWEAPEFVWNQQATFIPLDALKALGGVREDLHICMDYHMMVRLLAAGGEVRFTDSVLSRFRYHPLSKTTGPRQDFRLELVSALRSIPDLPVQVEAHEWDAQQARRMVDVARQAIRLGGYGHALGLLYQALKTSPTGMAFEIRRRYKEWRNRRSAIAATS